MILVVVVVVVVNEEVVVLLLAVALAVTKLYTCAFTHIYQPRTLLTLPVDIDR